MNLERLASCAELTTEHADDAATSSASMRVLLAWAARVARPGNGAPKVLMAIARLPQAEWVEGTPYIEISGDASTTTLAIFCDHGMGIRERLLPTCRFAVSIDEFSRAIRLGPRLIMPFRAVPRGGTMLLLTLQDVSEDQPEVISIAESSLHEQERKTAPPPPVVKESGPPTKETAPPTSATSGPKSPDQSGVHTHPTVRRMVAVRPEAFRRGGKDD